MLGQYFGNHGAYIIPAYAATVAVILALIVWTRLRYRRHLREIAALEQQGVSRRSAARGEAER